MTNIISIYNLSKAFDGKKLFQNFNFTVKKNSVHALIGANGAGKTTLLRLLTGLYEPDEGKISVSGKHAMLLENDYLYEDKTGLENLKIFGLYFGYYVKDYKKYSDSLNIRSAWDTDVGCISTGSILFKRNRLSYFSFFCSSFRMYSSSGKFYNNRFDSER